MEKAKFCCQTREINNEAIRIAHAKPNGVPVADYYLIYEGYLNSDAEIQLV